MENKELEDMLLSTNVPATRITVKLVESKIAKVQYHEFEGTNFVVCCLTLHNGFNVSGTSAALNPDMYDLKKAEKLAYIKACAEIWKLEAYLLKQRQYMQEK